MAPGVEGGGAGGVGARGPAEIGLRAVQGQISKGHLKRFGA